MIRSIFNTGYRKSMILHLRREKFKIKVAHHAAPTEIQKSYLSGQINYIDELIDKIRNKSNK